MSKHGSSPDKGDKSTGKGKNLNLFWSIVNMIRGSMAPELEEWARGIAASIPEDSFLRSAFTKRVFGAVSQFVENRLSHSSQAMQVIGEMGVDLGELVSSELASEHGTAPALQGWQKQFFVEARKRLKEAQGGSEEEVKQLKKRILLEYSLLLQIAKEVSKEIKPAHAHPKTLTGTAPDSLSAQIKSGRVRLQAFRARHGLKPLK